MAGGSFGSQNAALRGGQSAFGLLGNTLNAIDQAEQTGSSGVPGYIPPSQLTQSPVYKPTQVGLQPPSQMSPLAQQIMQRAKAPQPVMGLPAALMQMQGQINQPMMQGSMPQYQNPALNYRPDMTQAQTRLNNVAKSVILQQKEAAEAELAQMKAAEEARRQQEQNNNFTMG